MGKRDLLVLVDDHGSDLKNPDGTVKTIDKLEAHCKGLLHKAVSVFIFNEQKQLLLQKRASEKYHSPDRWTNTCCTHPLPGEVPFVTAQKRLREEMGLECPLSEAFSFLYKAHVGNGLIENEFDHVFIGYSNQNPNPDPSEVSDWKWISIEELKKEISENPEAFSVWVRACLGKVSEYVFSRD